MIQQMTKKNDQLKQLDNAYQNFVKLVNALPPTDLLRTSGGWTARDIVAHLIGWNHNILIGCQQIRTGVIPFYYNDALNDYRNLNGEFIARNKSTVREALLKELEKGKDELVSFLNEVNEQEWDMDFGAQHYPPRLLSAGRSDL